MSPVETGAQALFIQFPDSAPPPDAMLAVLRDLVASPREVAELWDPVLDRLAQLRADPFSDAGSPRAEAA